MRRLWSLLVLVLLCALAACTRQSIIRKDIQNGNTAALMQFVRDNAGNLKERDNIFFAVDEAVRNGSPAMLASIEDLYFDKAVSDQVRAHVLDAFVASHKATSNSARLLGALSQTDPNGADFQKLVTFMQRSPVAERKSLVTNNLFSSLNANSCDGDKSGRKALQLAKSILPEKTDDLGQIKSDFEIATDSVCKLQDLRDTIESRTSDMHQWDEFLNNKPFLLTGYIVSLVKAMEGASEYEIIVSGTGQHALLFASTQFESTGAFRMKVTRSVDMGVKVKPEFGSFNATWKTYVEDSPDDEERRTQRKKEVQGYKQEIEKAQAEIAELNRQAPSQLTTFNQRLCAFEETCAIAGLR